MTVPFAKFAPKPLLLISPDWSPVVTYQDALKARDPLPPYRIGYRVSARSRSAA